MKLLRATFILLFSFFLFGCPEKNEPQPTISTCRLESLTYDSDRVMVTDKYSYDAQGRLLAINGPGRNESLTYNAQGEIETTNLWSRDYQFMYDNKGNITKRVYRHKSSGSATYITFFEYSDRGHLIQATSLIAGGTFGNSYIEKLYRSNFQQFLNEGLVLYNAEANSARKQSIMHELETMNCHKYAVDEAGLTVTETHNTEKLVDGKTLERFEYVAAIEKYDGKKNAKNTKTWKWFNIIAYNKDFSELGNIVDAYDPSPNVGSSFYKYSINYTYNEAAYPISSEISGDFVGKGSTWMYECK